MNPICGGSGPMSRIIAALQQAHGKLNVLTPEVPWKPSPGGMVRTSVTDAKITLPPTFALAGGVAIWSHFDIASRFVTCKRAL
jgi:hypothetical protein